jgi:hypothetical protein
MGRVTVVLTLSIHLYPCQGEPRPFTLAWVEVDGQSQATTIWRKSKHLLLAQRTL